MESRAEETEEGDLKPSDPINQTLGYYKSFCFIRPRPPKNRATHLSMVCLFRPEPTFLVFTFA
ncbi:unnamed protein product, partial [Nesidiocoris tenuis]